MGHCRHCGGRLVYRAQACRNTVPIVTCDQCGTEFDRSYSPSWVFVEVQTQRRSCLASPIKFLLRDCQLSPPRFVSEQYWIVYDLPNGRSVFYHSGLQRYDVGGASEQPLAIGNAQNLIDWLAESIQKDPNTKSHDERNITNG
jgi:hypothetical protein